jgi:hypothetical protein
MGQYRWLGKDEKNEKKGGGGLLHNRIPDTRGSSALGHYETSGTVSPRHPDEEDQPGQGRLSIHRIDMDGHVGIHSQAHPP